MKKRNRKREVLTIDLPEYWAGFLINNDASNMEAEEITECLHAVKDLGYCAGVSEESFFATYKGIGHTMATYTFIVN
jgi:hypothetical protein